MQEITLTLHPYPLAPTYNLHVRATNLDMPAEARQALFEGKTVTVKLFVDPDPDTELDIVTIEKIIGHIKIDVPPGWCFFSNTFLFPHKPTDPKVTVVTNGEEKFEGFITYKELSFGLFQ